MKGKHITKTIISFLLTIGMIFTMAATSFAAQTGSLTINGTESGRKYDIYKVFDLTQSGTAYSYTVNPTFAAYFAENNITDPVEYVEGLKEAEAIAAFAEKLAHWAAANNIAPVKTVDAASEGTTTTVSDLEYGYYLLSPLGGTKASGENKAMFSLGTVGETATINIKAEYPTIDKKIVEGEEEKTTNEASIGDTINFKITTAVPDMAAFDAYKFVISDTLDEGLTFTDDSLVVKIGDTTLTAGTDYRFEQSTDKQSFDIKFLNFIQHKAKKGETITVTYKAVLNEKAKIGSDSNDNTVKLTYSNDPKHQGDGETEPSDDPEIPTGETPEVKTHTYTTSLTLNKVDENKTSLAGAAFRITGGGVNTVLVTGKVYEADENGSYYKLNDGTYTTTAPTEETTSSYASTTQKYALKTVATPIKQSGTVNVEGFVDDSGKLVFTGLGAGTYTISEIVVPNGYNKIDDFNVQINFSLDAETGKGTFTTTTDGVTVADNKLSMEVVNQSGSVLPSTGGMGTTLFYTFGAILVIGAAVLLVTRRRMRVEK